MKKSWHPQRSGNVAATHKAEAEAIAERKKLQQRLQEIEEERRKEEIQKALEAAGGKPRLQRVEWMYSGPTDGQAGDAAENEAYLLGKRRIDKLLQDNEVKKLQKQPSQDALVTAPAAATNARDMATKIREDPLLAIKRQEQQAYEAMMNDPIKRRQLLASMGIDDEKDKARNKEERRHRHRHSSHRSHRHHDDDRDDERRSRRHRSRSADRSRSPRRYGSEDEDRRRRRRDSRDRRRDRSESTDSRYRRDRKDGRDRRSRERRDSRDRRAREESRSRSPAPARKEYSPDSRDRRRRDDFPARDGRRRGHSAERDGPSRRYRDDSYRSNNNSSRFRNDRDYNRGRNNAEPASTDNKDEDRARKLAEMQAAATDLDQDRERRLAAIEQRDRAEQETDERARQRNKRFGGDAGFMNQLHSRAAELKVASRVGRR